MPKPEGKAKRARQPLCGRVVGKLCSDLFREEYDVNRVQNLLRYFSRQYQFHEFFDDLPRDMEGKEFFNPKVFRDYAQGVHEHIYTQLKHRERNNPNYEIRVLPPVVKSILKDFLRKASKAQQEIHRLKVNKELIETITIRLSRREITLEDLKLLAQKPVPQKAWWLSEALKQCPGFRHVWFKIERVKGRQILYMLSLIHI